MIRDKTGMEIPDQLGALETCPVRFSETVDRENMAEEIAGYADSIID